MNAAQTSLSSSSSLDRPGSDSDAAQTAGACDRLLQRFGGVRPMASKLEIPVTTVQGWKRRGAIPASRAEDLRAAAHSHGIVLDEAELAAALRFEERSPESAGAAPTETPVEAANPFSFPASTTSAAPPAPRLFERPLSARAQVVPASRPTAGNGVGPVRVAVAAAGIAVLAAVVAVVGMDRLPMDNGVPMPASALERRVADLEGKVARVALDQSATASALDRTALDLGGRVASVEMGLPALERKIAAHGVGSPALGTLLAATQFRTALTGPGPFQNELAAVRMIGVGATDPVLRQDIDQIANHAGTGIATEAWLVGRFALVAADINRAANYDNMLGRVADGFYDFLASWVPPLYRLTGVEEGTSPRSMAERAQAWMGAGNFPRAVEQLDQLTGLPAEAAAPWLAQAHARVAADRIRLQLGRISASAPSSSAPPTGK